MSEHQPALADEGIALVGVGTGATWQAAVLREDGVAFPLLSDLDRQLYVRLGLPNHATLRLARPASVWRYAQAVGRNLHSGPVQGCLAGDTTQLPGTVVFDATGNVRGLHRGTGFGDYPSIKNTLAKVRAAAG